LRVHWALDTITLLVAGLLAAVEGKYEARIMLLGIGIFSPLSLHDMFGAPAGIWLMPAGTFMFIILWGHILYHRFTENSGRLVTYSHEHEENSQRLDDTRTIIHHEIKHYITVHKNCGDIPKISCFPGHLNQVFLNLFINAKQAVKGKGEIFITTLGRDNRIFVEIRDSGEGIPKDKLEKIFDPGYTTTGVGVGTGLGLSFCYQIIEDHGERSRSRARWE
jgi:signal transduction histidine kinase